MRMHNVDFHAMQVKRFTIRICSKPNPAEIIQNPYYPSNLQISPFQSNIYDPGTTMPNLECCHKTTHVYSCGHTAQHTTILCDGAGPHCGPSSYRLYRITWSIACTYCLDRTKAHESILLELAGGRAYNAEAARLETAQVEAWREMRSTEGIEEEMRVLELRKGEVGRNRYSCGHYAWGRQWVVGSDVGAVRCGSCVARHGRHTRFVEGG